VTSFVNEPHEAICSHRTAPTLNLVAAEHEPIRSASVELAGDGAPTLDMPKRHALLRAFALVSEVIYGAYAKVDRSEKVDALKRLSRFARSTEPA
jgi:hypothetical protein